MSAGVIASHFTDGGGGGGGGGPFQRFYMPSTATGVPAITPAPGSVWDQTGSVIRRPLRTAPSNTAIVGPAAAYVAETVTTSPWDVLLFQYLSDPIAAQTIDGTLSFVAKALESAGASDLYVQIAAHVVSGDGSTLRGTLYAGNTATVFGSPNNVEMSSLATRIYNAVAVSPVTAQAGDRLVVEVGYRSLNTFSSSAQGGVESGDPTSGTDYALANNTATGNRPWLEFSDPISFL